MLVAANLLMSKHPMAKPRPKTALLTGVKSVFTDVPFIFSLLSCVTHLSPFSCCIITELRLSRAFISGLGLFFPCKTSFNTLVRFVH